MIALLERLLPLWTQPVDARADAEAAFGEVYANPVVVNGSEMTLAELAGRARSLQGAFDRLEMEILDAIETPDRIVIAFVMRGAACRPAHLAAGDGRADWARHRGAYHRRSHDC